MLPPGDGLPLLGDFGEARLGDEEHNEGNLKTNWDYKVNIWSVGMLDWDIVGSHTLVQGKNADGI